MQALIVVKTIKKSYRFVKIITEMIKCVKVTEKTKTHLSNFCLIKCSDLELKSSRV